MRPQLRVRRSQSTAHLQSAQRAPMPARLRPYGPTAFAGRDRELEALRRVMAAAANSGRQAAFVTGEAGIGKTRIVSELARGAHADGVLVLGGRCDDGLGLPYQPFVEILEHVVAHASAELLERHIFGYGESVARLVPELSARAGRRPAPEHQSGEAERYVLFRAIEGLLAEVCETGPVLLVLEDLHWADQPTLTLLRRILTSPREWPLMVLSTARVEGSRTAISCASCSPTSTANRNVLRVNLAGLGSEDVLELVRGIPSSPQGGVDERLAATLEAGTNGNPFFIVELVRSLSESGALEINDGRLCLPEGVELADAPAGKHQRDARSAATSHGR